MTPKNFMVDFLYKLVYAIFVYSFFSGLKAMKI